ncbi:MAG: hypothetical protein ACP5M4_09290 [Acidobacteriaceae bacterium]
MANTYVVTIGFDQSITMNSGDGLFLVFCEHRKFCLTSDNWSSAFPNNPLPVGDQAPGTVWPSNGSPAIAQTSGQVVIGYTSRGAGNGCPPPGAHAGDTMPGHTITVG